MCVCCVEGNNFPCGRIFYTFWRRRRQQHVCDSETKRSADSRSPGCGPLLWRITFDLCTILGWPIHAAELCLKHATAHASDNNEMTLLPTYGFCLFICRRGARNSTQIMQNAGSVYRLTILHALNNIRLLSDGLLRDREKT